MTDLRTHLAAHGMDRPEFESDAHRVALVAASAIGQYLTLSHQE